MSSTIWDNTYNQIFNKQANNNSQPVTGCEILKESDTSGEDKNITSVAFPTSNNLTLLSTHVNDYPNLTIVRNMDNSLFEKWAVIYFKDNVGYGFNNIHQVFIFKILNNKTTIIYKNTRKNDKNIVETNWDNKLNIIYKNTRKNDKNIVETNWDNKLNIIKTLLDGCYSMVTGTPPP